MKKLVKRVEANGHGEVFVSVPIEARAPGAAEGEKARRTITVEIGQVPWSKERQDVSVHLSFLDTFNGRAVITVGPRGCDPPDVVDENDTPMQGWVDDLS